MGFTGAFSYMHEVLCYIHTSFCSLVSLSHSHSSLFYSQIIFLLLFQVWFIPSNVITPSSTHFPKVNNSPLHIYATIMLSLASHFLMSNWADSKHGYYIKTHNHKGISSECIHRGISSECITEKRATTNTEDDAGEGRAPHWRWGYNSVSLRRNLWGVSKNKCTTCLEFLPLRQIYI